MNILLSNDDGFLALGLNELYDKIKDNHDVRIIAPDRERSSCGHAITLTKALRVKEVEQNIYSCTGFPADCVLIGIGHVLKNKRPDLVISGINHGANLGQDRFYSGTMAAAREAVFRGVKAISVSLVNASFKEKSHFKSAALFVNKLLELNIQNYIPDGCMLNINVPSLLYKNIKGVKLATSGFQLYTEEVIERVDFRDTKYYWVGGRYEGCKDIKGSDCNIVLDHYISVELQGFDGKSLDEENKKLQKVIDCIF